jgi:hypothetical protein
VRIAISLKLRELIATTKIRRLFASWQITALKDTT